MARPNRKAAEAAVRQLLVALGHDVTREGLRGTPERVAKALVETHRRDPFVFTTFDAEGMDEMIVEAPIAFYSTCEHHMLPFFGVAAVGYIPNGKIVGLSKLARAVQHCAAGLQNQERITSGIADMMRRKLAPRGVGVVLRARHLCMEMRGAKSRGTYTTTSKLLGAIRRDGSTRSEFMRLAMPGLEP